MTFLKRILEFLQNKNISLIPLYQLQLLSYEYNSVSYDVILSWNKDIYFTIFKYYSKFKRTILTNVENTN